MAGDSRDPAPHPGRAVFLSYASEDVAAAERICTGLRAAGIEVWFDKNELEGGEAWDRKIRRQIRDCALFVPVISASSQARPEGYFRLEWDLADQRTHLMGRNRAFLVPISVDATPERDADVPDSFLAAHWTRLPGGETDPAFVERIHRLLSGEVVTTEASRSAGAGDEAGASAPRSFMGRRMLLYAAVATVALLSIAYFTRSRWSSFSTQTADPNSIAVLPFLNLSGDVSREFFSEGLTEELLNVLTKIPELRVTSRSSSFSIRDKNLPAPEIGKLLHVAHVLEGSVRKSGDRIRIAAQLIDTLHDTQVWAETYDRKLDDIFAVQDEISAAVVEHLRVSLLTAVPHVKRVDPRVFELFLKGRQLARLHTQNGYEQSVAFYREALAIDPAYAPIWAGLAYDYRRQANNDFIPLAEGYGLATDAAQHALQIDPAFAPAYAELGRIALDHDGDLAAAARHLEHAFSLEPANAEIIGYCAILTDSLGRIDQSIALNEHAVQRDPANPTLHTSLGIDYTWAGKYGKAIEHFRAALEQSPDEIGTHYRMGEALLLSGDASSALVEFQREPLGAWHMIGLPLAYHSLHRSVQSNDALRSLVEKHANNWPYNIAYVYAWRGDATNAFAWLDKGVTARDPSLSDVVAEPLFATVRNDPRWLPFLRKIGRAPEMLGNIKFDVWPPRR